VLGCSQEQSLAGSAKAEHARMEIAVLLSVAASFFTATSSVCQRLGARDVHVTGFDPWLVFRLARRPVWLLGFACMLTGFGLQVAALHYGPLALVQPILAAELLFVFAYLAVLTGRQHARRVRLREWLAAVAMSAGISVFLGAAAPSGGRPHAPAPLWWLSGLIIGGCVLLLLALATRLLRARADSQSDVDWTARQAVRRAAILGVATGISWGFVAAVIKELSSHTGQGLGGVFGNWAVYVLMATGAAAFLLVSHALAAGPLAASQPGFTILDPLTASLLGLFLFAESMRTGPVALAGEVAGLVVLVAGVVTLSHSRLITGEEHPGLCNEIDGRIHAQAELASQETKR
jgi:drug/metabolite transporter (DMT)-like permease